MITEWLRQRRVRKLQIELAEERARLAVYQRIQIQDSISLSVRADSEAKVAGLELRLTQLGEKQ